MHQSAPRFRSTWCMANENWHLGELGELPVPQHLLGRVMQRIGAEQRLASLRKRFAAVAVVSLGVLVSVVPAWDSVQLALTQSGFSTYLGLAFSDPSVVATAWQDYSLSLLESFPMVEAAVFLGAAFTFLFALKLSVAYGARLLQPHAPLATSS